MVLTRVIYIECHIYFSFVLLLVRSFQNCNVVSEFRGSKKIKSQTYNSIYSTCKSRSSMFQSEYLHFQYWSRSTPLQNSHPPYGHCQPRPLVQLHDLLCSQWLAGLSKEEVHLKHMASNKVKTCYTLNADETQEKNWEADQMTFKSLIN